MASVDQNSLGRGLSEKLQNSVDDITIISHVTEIWEELLAQISYSNTGL